MHKMMAVPVLALIAFAIAACSDPTSNYVQAKTTAAKNETYVKPGEQPSGAVIKELKIRIGDSKISFLGSKVTASHPGGFKVFSGRVLSDGLTVSKVEVEIDMDSIWAQDEGMPAGEINKKLTDHLKSNDFFDVKNHKTATFVTTKIEDKGEGKFMVTGNLTISNKTNSIEFPATIKIESGKVTAKSDKFKIDRTKWGIVYKGAADNVIRDDVGLEFYIIAD